MPEGAWTVPSSASNASSDPAACPVDVDSADPGASLLFCISPADASSLEHCISVDAASAVGAAAASEDVPSADGLSVGVSPADGSSSVVGASPKAGVSSTADVSPADGCSTDCSPSVDVALEDVWKLCIGSSSLASSHGSASPAEVLLSADVSADGATPLGEVSSAAVVSFSFSTCSASSRLILGSSFPFVAGSFTSSSPATASSS